MTTCQSVSFANKSVPGASWIFYIFIRSFVIVRIWEHPFYSLTADLTQRYDKTSWQLGFPPRIAIAAVCGSFRYHTSNSHRDNAF